MKLKQHQFSTQTQISKKDFIEGNYPELKKPNPPTEDDIRKAKFRDKTFDWTSNNRPRNKRSA